MSVDAILYIPNAETGYLDSVNLNAKNITYVDKDYNNNFNFQSRTYTEYGSNSGLGV